MFSFIYILLLLNKQEVCFFSFDILIIGSEGDLNPKCVRRKYQLSYKAFSTNFFLVTNSILIIYIILIIK